MSEESNIEKLVGVATLSLSNIGILLHVQATWTKHFAASVYN